MYFNKSTYEGDASIEIYWLFEQSSCSVKRLFTRKKPNYKSRTDYFQIDTSHDYNTDAHNPFTPKDHFGAIYLEKEHPLELDLTNPVLKHS